MTRYSTREPIAALLSICALLVLGACSREDVRLFEVPKANGTEGSLPAVATMNGEQALALRWVVPSTWKVLPADGLRIASFNATGAVANQVADISVVTFVGTGGDDLSNVNRWRAQVQQAPLLIENLAASVSSIPTGAGQVSVVAIDGTSPTSGEKEKIIGAWVRSPNRVWFIKINGPTDLVDSQQQVFYDFVKTLHFDSPESAKPVGQAAAAPSISAGIPDSVTWVAPASWKLGPPTSMRKASFDLGSGVEVSVSAFPGDVGGLLANVNRWRTQVGVDPITDEQLAHDVTHMAISGGELAVISAGPASTGGRKIISATLSAPGQTWFFKLTGDELAVARARPEFDAFLTSITSH